METFATPLLRSSAASNVWRGHRRSFQPHNFTELYLGLASKLDRHLSKASRSKGNMNARVLSVKHSRKKILLVNAHSADDEPHSYNHRDDEKNTILVEETCSSTTDSSPNVTEEQNSELAKDNDSDVGETALKGTIVAGLLLIGAVSSIGVASYAYREQINAFLIDFSDVMEGYGVAGYALFVAVYAGLEVLAIPAIPLTMSAGLLFGTVKGTIIVSISGTIAATAAFLIARYLVRDRILKLASGNKKFLAIDKAIGEKSFRVVTLLRLSPLLPFSLGNYLYGLTSVKLLPYILGSWLGMLPGTWAYVSAGAVGRALIQEAEAPFSGGHEQLITLGVGLLITVSVAAYVTQLAKDAIKDVE